MAMRPLCSVMLLFLAVPVMAAAPPWTPVGLTGGGGTTTPAICPLDPTWLIVNCDMSGAYQSYDGGKTWQMLHYRQLTANTFVRPVFSPTDAKTAYAVNGWSGELRVTHDKGATWTDVPGAPTGVSAFALDPGRPARLLAGRRHQEGVHRSEDGGRTWTLFPGPKGRLHAFHFDLTSPARARICFAASDRSVYRSDDGGATWLDIGQGLPVRPVLAFAGGSNRKRDTCVLYASLESREVDGQVVGGIWRSEDRGATWTRAMGPGIDQRDEAYLDRPVQPSQYQLIVTTDIDPSRIYASRGFGGRLFRSDDRGSTWHKVMHQHMADPAFNLGPNYLVDDHGGGGSPISGLGVNPADPDHVIANDWGSVYTSRDGGKHWACANTLPTEPGRRGKGLPWVNNGLVVTSVWHYYIDPFEPARHYIAYTDIGYARSTDAGKTWYYRGAGVSRNTTYELAFDPEIPGKIWAAFADLHDIPNNNVISGAHYFTGASGSVGLSTDFGVTYEDTSKGLPQKPILSVVLDQKSPVGKRTLYASAFEDGVYKSTDDGKTWVKKSEGLGAPGTNMRTCRIILHPDGTLFCLVTALRVDDVYLPEGPGLYRSADGAEHWECITAGQAFLWPKDFDVDPRDSKVVYLGVCDTGDWRGGPKEGGLYQTTDGGATWSLLVRKGPQTFGATIHPRKPDWVYMCLTESAPDSGLWLSKDAGKTWQPLEGLPFKNAQRVTFDPKDDSVIYVSTFGGSVWKGPAS